MSECNLAALLSYGYYFDKMNTKLLARELILNSTTVGLLALQHFSKALILWDGLAI